jgi:STE24 endopeptidase
MLLTTLVVIVVLAFVVESILDHLNQGSSLKDPDPIVSHLYNSDERSRSIAYGAAKSRLGLISSTLSTGLTILALTFGWFASLDSLIREGVSNSILVSLLFIGALSAITWLISLPFSIYSTFVIEERFGFNKSTPKTFVLDIIKGSAVGFLIGTPILAAIIWLYERFADRFWLYGWLLVSGFSLFMFAFGTRLVLPLFNKLTPLPEGELRSEISEYCAAQGYALRNLFVMDGSRRSTKANAFFSGLGKSKIIVLFDTLIDNMNKDEIVAVLAHEVGHYKRKHTFAMLIASNLQTLALFALLGWALGYSQLSESLGADQPSFHLSALAFFILLTPLELVLGLINNSLSRRNEYDADNFAAATYGKAAMRSALSKLPANNLSNLSPHPLYVAFNYTHPPIAQRLRNLS